MEGENTQQTGNQAPQNYSVPFAIIVAGIAIAAAVYFGDGQKAPTPAVAVAAAGANAPTVVDPVTSADHIIGNPNAKIIIVEYSDTECPFCKSFHPTMQRIMNDYGNSGKVAWVYRHFPLQFHSKSPKEAEATECVSKLGGNIKFWEYLNKIFETTAGNNQLDPAELPKLAKVVGIDVTAFNKCLASGEMKTIVDKDLLSGTRAGVSGTPFSVILVDKKVVNGINGAQPYEAVKAIVDDLLK